MTVYKVTYIKECEYIREIEASSIEEAQKKFFSYDYLKDYEQQCIGEDIIKITEK